MTELTNEVKTILVADDDPDMLDQISMILKGQGFKVLTANSQKAAETLLTKESFNLAVLDLMMEQQDSGFVLAYKIKSKCPNIPVIIVTAVTKETGIHFDKPQQAPSQWIKADVILDKDLRSEQLIGEVNRLLAYGGVCN